MVAITGRPGCAGRSKTALLTRPVVGRGALVSLPMVFPAGQADSFPGGSSSVPRQYTLSRSPSQGSASMTLAGVPFAKAG